MSRVLESTVERCFMRLAKAAGLTVLKLNLQGNAGYPDRLCFLPGGHIAFIEFKRPGAKVRPLQAYIHQRLRTLGFAVEVFDDARVAAAWVESKKRETDAENC